MQRKKDKLEQARETAKFLKEKLSRYPAGCRPFSSCITWSELDDAWQPATEADYTWHITFLKGTTKRETMSQMHHALTTFQKEIEAQTQEASHRNVSTRATRGAYDTVMRSAYEALVKLEDIAINSDKPASVIQTR